MRWFAYAALGVMKMAENVINFGELAGAKDYVPVGFGPAAYLPYTGFTRAIILKIEDDTSSTGNGQLEVVMSVEDTFNGQPQTGTLYTNVLYSGTNKNGEPNSKQQLFPFLRSVGWTQERIDALANAKKVLKPAELIAEIMKSGPVVCHPIVKDDLSNADKPRSKVSGFKTKEEFERRGLSGKTARATTNGAAHVGAATVTTDILAGIGA